MARKRRYTQEALIKKLQDYGWMRQTGGKHQVKMVKEGSRPITIPEFRGESLPVGLSEAILKQAGIRDET